MNLWLYLVGLSGAAMAAAVFIAFFFARWVSRPLARLDGAARKIADGDLAVRAKTEDGPPELRRTAATFNMMAGRLEALVHGHRAMLADASHQLRTPLTALRLRLDLLAVDSPPAAAAELAGAQEEIARLSRLVDGLLATARAEAVTEQLEHIDVIEAVSERVAAWQPVGDGNEVKLIAEPSTLSPPPRSPSAPGTWSRSSTTSSTTRSRRSARRAARSGSSVARAEAGVMLTVADDGPGMTPQERSRAFLRFTTRQPERHRARPRHRAPARHCERRHHQARGHARRRADRRGRSPQPRRAVATAAVSGTFARKRTVKALATNQDPSLGCCHMSQPWWKPVWTVTAAMRAARATLVVPTLFAITYKVVGDPQMALFATFGGFATLIIAGFGGTRRDKFAAHLGLALAGSVALIIGTLAAGPPGSPRWSRSPSRSRSSSPGSAGRTPLPGPPLPCSPSCSPSPRPAARPRSPAGSRAGGWRPPPARSRSCCCRRAPGQPAARRRRRTGRRARQPGTGGRSRGGDQARSDAAAERAAADRVHRRAVPPDRACRADQAMSSLVQLLEWGATQAGDAFDGHINLTTGCTAGPRPAAPAPPDCSSDTARCSPGRPPPPTSPGLEAAREAAAERLRELTGKPGEPDSRLAAAQAVHAQGIAVVARGPRSADALIVATERAGDASSESDRRGTRRPRAGVTAAAAGRGAATLVRRHATVRSVWFLNSLRGAVALRGGRRRRGPVRCAARVLGGARHAVGAAHQRRLDRRDRVARPGRRPSPGS